MNRAVVLAVLVQTILVPTAFAADGESLFNGSCALCHQPGGIGSPGLAPPLVDKPLWDALGDAAPAYIAGVMLAGLSGTIEAAGQKISGLVMPPQDRMSDEELAAIGTYVLSILNHAGQKVDANTIAAVRSAPPSHVSLRNMRRSGS